MINRMGGFMVGPDGTVAPSSDLPNGVTNATVNGRREATAEERIAIFKARREAAITKDVKAAAPKIGRLTRMVHSRKGLFGVAGGALVLAAYERAKANSGRTGSPDPASNYGVSTGIYGT